MNLQRFPFRPNGAPAYFLGRPSARYIERYRDLEGRPTPPRARRASRRRPVGS